MDCLACGGSGSLSCQHCGGATENSRTCEFCCGTGWEKEPRKCPDCNGTGKQITTPYAMEACTIRIETGGQVTERTADCFDKALADAIESHSFHLRFSKAVLICQLICRSFDKYKAAPEIRKFVEIAEQMRIMLGEE